MKDMTKTEVSTTEPPTSGISGLPPVAFSQRPAIRQFVKFCIVGASSTLISMSIFSLLIYGLHLSEVLHDALASRPQWQRVVDEYRLHVQVAALIAFLFAVTNGFFWNSRWTFRQTDAAKRKTQYAKFVLVNAIGLVLNQIILFVVNRALTAGRAVNEKGWEPLIAFAIATCIVVFWNFSANKLWTFKDND
jgi:putative flippase GtrA